MTLLWKRDPRKRELRKELKRLRRIYEPDLDALRREGKATTEDYNKLVGEYLAMRDPVAEELLAIESRNLRLRALNWAVALPPSDYWKPGPYGYRHLDEATRIEIRASIRDQKRKSIKFIAQIAALAVGVLVALIGVFNACQNN